VAGWLRHAQILPGGRRDHPAAESLRISRRFAMGSLEAERL